MKSGAPRLDPRPVGGRQPTSASPAPACPAESASGYGSTRMAAGRSAAARPLVLAAFRGGGEVVGVLQHGFRQVQAVRSADPFGERLDDGRETEHGAAYLAPQLQVLVTGHVTSRHRRQLAGLTSGVRSGRRPPVPHLTGAALRTSALRPPAGPKSAAASERVRGRRRVDFTCTLGGSSPARNRAACYGRRSNLCSTLE